jgi:hypothetical protein
MAGMLWCFNQKHYAPELSMVQAHARELLNQKEAGNGDSHPLYAATERLIGALNRLEQGLAQVTTQKSRDVKQHEQLVVFERENANLREERDNLDSAIGQLQNQYDDLHKVAGAIYNKLDDSIKRLTQIIEG